MLSLEELEAAESLSESLQQANDTLRRATQEIGRVMGRMRGTALAFENTWKQIIAKVAKGQTAEMQAARPHLLSDFEKRLDLLKQGHALLTREHKEGWTDIPDPDFLLSEIAGMERLKARVFDAWQSGEDLEDLAARDYPLSTADLDQIGQHRRPPASWYAEESKPF